MVVPARLLLVEENETSRHSLARLLEMDGYHVEVAATIKEALEVAARVPVDVMLSDVLLPDGDGLDLMRTLSDRYDVKGVAISGFGDILDIENCHKAGFVAHLFKPVTLDMVESALEIAERYVISDSGAKSR